MAQEVQQDAGLIAEEYGVPVETVLNRLRHEEVVAGLVEEWAAQYPDSYAGAYHADGFAAASVVMWVGTVPNAVLAQAEPHGLSLSFDTSSPISANAFDQLTRDAAALLASTGHSEAIVEPSPKTKSLDVIVRGDDLAAPRLDATKNHLKTLLPNGVTSRITERDGQLVYSAARLFHGGAKIHDANRSSRYCTSAFAVTRAQADGLITAGHCTRMTRYKIPLVYRLNGCRHHCCSRQWLDHSIFHSGRSCSEQIWIESRLRLAASFNAQQMTRQRPIRGSSRRETQATWQR